MSFIFIHFFKFGLCLNSNQYIGMKKEVTEIEGPNSQKFNEMCVPGPCHILVPHCWCCEHLRGIRPQFCWAGKTGRDYCNQQCNLI